MQTIQACAKSIYSGCPDSIYFFTGPEYGVKIEYISKLIEIYENKYCEYTSFSELLSSVKQKSLIPKSKQLHLIRYDSAFISNLSGTLARDLFKAKFLGTVVGIYYDDKSERKLDTYFPENTVRVNALSDKVIKKHLVVQFPMLSEMHIDTVIRISEDYYKSKLICNLLSYLPSNIVHSLSAHEIESLFGYKYNYDKQEFKQAILSRDFDLCVKFIDSFEGDLSQLYYDIFSAYLDMIKFIENPRSDSYAKPFASLWSFQSLVTMFDIAYNQLEQLRMNSSYSVYTSLIYVCGLLKFKLV